MAKKTDSANEQTVIAQAEKPVKTAHESHPAHGVLAEIEAFFAKSGKLAERDLHWLRAKLAALRAKL